MRMGLLGKLAAGAYARAGAARRSAAVIRRVRMNASVELRAGRFDNRRPAREVALDLGAELLGRVRDRLDAVAIQALEKIRPADNGDRIVVDLLHDIARR